jgi:hypothetical protein
MSLSFSTTSMSASIPAWPPALLSASKAMPAVIAPSPMTATALRSSPFSLAAMAMPCAAEMRGGRMRRAEGVVLALVAAREAAMPPSWRSVAMRSRRPVRILCG